MKKVIILAGKDVRGIHYCYDSEILTTPEFAQHLVDFGKARWPVPAIQTLGEMEAADPMAFSNEKNR
jgi:hypothetical protein